MKRTKCFVSLFLAIVLIAIYILPSTGILRAASLSDFTKVTVLANSNFPVSTDLSQGVQFTTGSEYLTVTTTDATDPYFTVDMTDTSLKGKFIAIKFKATAIKPTDRYVSCDRFVDWTLYRAGYTAGQKYTHGHVVHEMDEWLANYHGFTRVNNVSTLRAGDIIFTRWDSTQPGNGAHVFLCASTNRGNNVYYRYDHGTNGRIWGTHGTEHAPGQQPFIEPILDFCYAYRP